jgi:hypothetical protein
MFVQSWLAISPRLRERERRRERGKRERGKRERGSEFPLLAHFLVFRPNPPPLCALRAAASAALFPLSSKEDLFSTHSAAGH